MLKDNLFLSHRAACTTVLFTPWLAEEKQPDGKEQQCKEHCVLIKLHLLFTETFF